MKQTNESELFLSRHISQLDRFSKDLAELNRPAEEILSDEREDDEDHDEEGIPTDDLESPSEAERNGQF